MLAIGHLKQCQPQSAKPGHTTQSTSTAPIAQLSSQTDQMATRLVILLLHLLSARQCASQLEEGGFDMFKLPPWEFDDATAQAFNDRCGNSATMIEMCGQGDMPPGETGIFFTGFATQPDAAQKKNQIHDAARRFPDLHCLATYMASGTIKTPAAMTPLYGCKCIACTAAEEAAQQAEFDGMITQAAAVQAYPKDDIYKECEDQDFWYVL